MFERYFYVLWLLLYIWCSILMVGDLMFDECWLINDDWCSLCLWLRLSLDDWILHIDVIVDGLWLVIDDWLLMINTVLCWWWAFGDWRLLFLWLMFEVWCWCWLCMYVWRVCFAVDGLWCFCWCFILLKLTLGVCVDDCRWWFALNCWRLMATLDVDG